MNHGKAREKAKKITYFLVEEFGSNPKDAATALNISVHTAYRWLNEMRLKKEIYDLRQENKALLNFTKVIR